jgi:hypothetical protein
MKNMIKVVSAVAVAFAITQTVQAIPTQITGAIGFGGNVTYDTSSAGTATQVTGWIGTQVISDTGTFASYITPVAPALFTTQTWNLNDPSTIISSFWQAGGFTFNLLSSYVVAQAVVGGIGFVVVSGTGTVSGNGYGPQTLNWSFTSQDPKSGVNPDQWTFSASANSVPDGGMTVMLLGIALSGVALLRKKLTA